MSESDMPTDPEQADLMHEMDNDGLLTAQSIRFDTGCGERTAYRIITGDSVLTLKQYRDLIRANDKLGKREVGDRLAGYAHRGTERLAVDMSYGEVGDVHGDAVTALRKLADLLDARRKHEADGVITPAESREEVEAYDECLHILHRGRKACVEQPTTERKQAKPLQLSGAKG